MGLYLFSGKWPAEEFDKDVKVLAGLPRDILSKLAEWYQSLEPVFPTSDEALDRLQELVPDRGVQDAVGDCVSVTRFILGSWHNLGLSLDQVTSDLEVIGLHGDELIAVREYLENLECMKHKTHVDSRCDAYAGGALPVLTGSQSVCDIRGVFGEDKKGSATTALMDTVPVVIVTVKSRWVEGPEQALTFQCTEANFSILVEALKKTQRQLAQLKRRMPRKRGGL